MYTVAPVRASLLLTSYIHVHAHVHAHLSLVSCSNYGPTIRIAKEAEKKGCTQVLWLFGENHEVRKYGVL